MSLPVASPVSAPPTPPRPMPAAPPRPALAIAAAAAAVVAVVTLSWDRPGVGWALTTLAVVAAVGATVGCNAGRWSAQATVRSGWAAAAVLLMAVGAVRAAAWLFVLCALTAALAGCVAVAGRWPVLGVLLAPVRVAARLPGALLWLVRSGSPTRGRDRVTVVRTLVAGLITVALLAVFGALLIGADAAFAHVLSTLVPRWDLGTVVQSLTSAAFAAAITATAAHVLLFTATSPEETPRTRQVRRVEWALPVAGLVTLFSGFVAVQATVLFGGKGHVLQTAGLTYAQYARSGFWQLLAVTGLTLIVAGTAARVAPRAARTDRVLLRVLLGLLSALTLVIVASALSRMAAYEHAYGFTRQRLLVTTCELWLGAVFVLILIAGIRLRGRWIPQAALAAAVAALLGLGVLNPDAFIARHNIAQFRATGRIDVDYLKTLSADAVPALQTLPARFSRDCALSVVNEELTNGRSDTWFAGNLGRSTARRHLRADPPAPVSSVLCPH